MAEIPAGRAPPIKWTDEEVEFLKKYAPDPRVSWEDIAMVMKRSTHSVRSKVRKLRNKNVFIEWRYDERSAGLSSSSSSSSCSLSASSETSSNHSSTSSSGSSSTTQSSNDSITENTDPNPDQQCRSSISSSKSTSSEEPINNPTRSSSALSSEVSMRNNHHLNHPTIGCESTTATKTTTNTNTTAVMTETMTSSSVAINGSSPSKSKPSTPTDVVSASQQQLPVHPHVHHQQLLHHSQLAGLTAAKLPLLPAFLPSAEYPGSSATSVRMSTPNLPFNLAPLMNGMLRRRQGQHPSDLSRMVCNPNVLMRPPCVSSAPHSRLSATSASLGSSSASLTPTMMVSRSQSNGGSLSKKSVSDVSHSSSLRTTEESNSSSSTAVKSDVCVSTVLSSGSATASSVSSRSSSREFASATAIGGVGLTVVPSARLSSALKSSNIGSDEKESETKQAGKSELEEEKIGNMNEDGPRLKRRRMNNDRSMMSRRSSESVIAKSVQLKPMDWANEDPYELNAKMQAYIDELNTKKMKARLIVDACRRRIDEIEGNGSKDSRTMVTKKRDFLDEYFY